MHHFAKLIRNPLLVIDAAGTIAELNEAARSLCGDVTQGDEIFVDPGHTLALLQHASGWGDPVSAALDVRTKAGAVQRCQVRALALRDGEPTQYAIELRDATENRFAALTEQVRDLDREVAARQASQAQLVKVVARNDMLYRELQHRVKNNLQMIISLIAMAEREDPDISGQAFLQALNSKLAALLHAQHLMYEESTGEAVPSDRMIQAIAVGARSLARHGVCMTFDLDNALLPNELAFSLALIANELLTNATKHGCAATTAAVDVALRHGADEVVLTVADQGPGFVVSPTGRASSGLGLVRGLCRQIGGRLVIVSDANGTIARVHFPLRPASDAV